MALFQNHPDKNSDPQNQEMAHFKSAPTQVMRASFNIPPKKGNGQKEVSKKLSDGNRPLQAREYPPCLFSFEK